MVQPPRKSPTARPAAKAAPHAAKPGATRPSAAKSPAPAKPAPAKKTAAPGKSGGTTGGRLTIAILGGLAVGLVAMLIYSMVDSKSDYAFNRPEAQLPSLQAKHTLQ
jgi:hypothetical protein